MDHLVVILLLLCSLTETSMDTIKCKHTYSNDAATWIGHVKTLKGYNALPLSRITAINTMIMGKWP